MNHQKPHIRSARDVIRNNRSLIRFSFLQATEDVIRNILSSNKKESEQLRQELSLLREGRLFIHYQKKKNRYYFGDYSGSGSKETGISGDEQRIYALARRDYLEYRLHILDEMTRSYSLLLDKTAHLRDELRKHSRLQRFADAGLDLSRILFSGEQNEWIDQPYSPNPFHQESLTAFTNAGIPVRSKTEAAFGSALESIGIPYRYDDLIRIPPSDYGEEPYRDSYFADFKVPNLIGGITVHEHLGAFQAERYADNSLKRLNDYRNHPIIEIPGHPVSPVEITWSFENDVRDPSMRDKLIRRVLLPGLPL